MSKYHYEIIVDLTTLKPTKSISEPEKIAFYMFGDDNSTTLHFDTNNRLVKDELLTIRSNESLINLELTRITRHHAELSDDNELIEMDMTMPYGQENRPKNTTDEVWFTCKANALFLSI